jgi:Transglutaminase-like superfamily
MPTSIITTLRRAANLNPTELHLLTIAVKELAIARMKHATQPVEKILAQFEKRKSGAFGGKNGEPSRVDLARLSWAIAAASVRVPWRSDCLLQAMAADRWMRRLDLRPDFFLGVGKDQQGNLISHAWLRHGDFTVTGGIHDEFKVILGPPSPQS